MKRILVCTLIAATLAATPVFASEISLADMSLEELVELRTSITAEIETRTADSSGESISAGVYIAGTDIKAGSFKISPIADGSSWVYVFTNEDDYKVYKGIVEQTSEEKPEPIFDSFLCDEKSAVVNLKEGNLLYLSEELSIEESKASWMPDKTE